MCGIFGYIGKKNSVSTVLEGIKKLEYRGYDSAGIAGLKEGKIYFCKEVGKISALEKMIKETHLELDFAITHTRWATHGKPSRENAHPHFDTNKTLAVVHNGIIENYDSLKKALQGKGIQFISETDTEVVAHLIASFYQGDLLKAVQQAVPLLKGSFAIALIHQDYPRQIIAFAKESPLAVGIGNKEVFLASDPNAFAQYTNNVAYLTNSEIAVIKEDKIELFNSSLEQLELRSQELNFQVHEITKNGYAHYTLKEIHEQPQTLKNALISRFLEDYGTAYFEGLSLQINELLSIERILILACGTSWHAGYVGSYIFEEMARIPVQVEISSEYRYKNPVVPQGTLTIAISQSGETADTIAAVRELKAKGGKILALCNVQSSTLAREADHSIFLHAGPEIGVCSTKAFTSQVAVLALLALLMARMRHMSKPEGQDFLKGLKDLPAIVEQVIQNSDHIKSLAKKYAKYDNFFFIGRQYMYPTSLEGSLKLKEISYINSSGYPAGEMKHGPIALINEDCPTIALCANKLTYEKLISNLMEVKARNGLIIAVAEQSQESIFKIADDVIVVPDTKDQLAAIPTSVALQLFAYYVALERGTDIDQPRNLAKSVTVE